MPRSLVAICWPRLFVFFEKLGQGYSDQFRFTVIELFRKLRKRIKLLIRKRKTGSFLGITHENHVTFPRLWFQVFSLTLKIVAQSGLLRHLFGKKKNFQEALPHGLLLD